MKRGAEVVEQPRRTDISGATENGMSVIRADDAGRVDGLESYGSSWIVEPDGSVLRIAKPLAPDLLIADIQMGSETTVRKGDTAS